MCAARRDKSDWDAGSAGSSNRNGSNPWVFRHGTSTCGDTFLSRGIESAKGKQEGCKGEGIVVSHIVRRYTHRGAYNRHIGIYLMGTLPCIGWSYYELLVGRVTGWAAYSDTKKLPNIIPSQCASFILCRACYRSCASLRFLHTEHTKEHPEDLLSS